MIIHSGLLVDSAERVDDLQALGELQSAFASDVSARIFSRSSSARRSTFTRRSNS
jgi:hypothetical protein